jgi:hypothetical protein
MGTNLSGRLLPGQRPRTLRVTSGRRLVTRVTRVAVGLVRGVLTGGVTGKGKGSTSVYTASSTKKRAKTHSGWSWSYAPPAMGCPKSCLRGVLLSSSPWNESSPCHFSSPPPPWLSE